MATPVASAEDPRGPSGGNPQNSSGLIRRAAGVAKNSQLGWLLFALVTIMVVFTALNPSEFLSSGNLLNVATDAAVLLVVTVGMTFVIVTGGIDLSVGAVLVISQIVAAKVLVHMQSASLAEVLVVGTLLCCACGALWGAINGALVTLGKIPPLIATLGTLGAATGAADLLTNGENITAPVNLGVEFGGGSVLGIPWLVIVAAVIALIGGIVLAQTKFGRYTIAIGSNAQAARRAGVSDRTHLFKIYVLAGALSGLAGLLSLAEFSTTTLAGHSTDNLNAVAAVVIGGTSLFGGVGTMLGSVIGVFIPALLQDGFVLENTQPYWQQIVVAIVLVTAVGLDQRRRKNRASR